VRPCATVATSRLNLIARLLRFAGRGAAAHVRSPVSHRASPIVAGQDEADMKYGGGVPARSSARAPEAAHGAGVTDVPRRGWEGVPSPLLLYRPIRSASAPVARVALTGTVTHRPGRRVPAAMRKARTISALGRTHGAVPWVRADIVLPAPPISCALQFGALCLPCGCRDRQGVAGQRGCRATHRWPMTWRAAVRSARTRRTGRESVPRVGRTETRVRAG